MHKDNKVERNKRHQESGGGGALKCQWLSRVAATEGKSEQRPEGGKREAIWVAEAGASQAKGAASAKAQGKSESGTSEE